jgi:hypothetical protein
MLMRGGFVFEYTGNDMYLEDGRKRKRKKHLIADVIFLLCLQFYGVSYIRFFVMSFSFTCIFVYDARETKQNKTELTNGIDGKVKGTLMRQSDGIFFHQYKKHLWRLIHVHFFHGDICR